VPTPGKSAIEVEQPPTASADTNSAAIDHSLIVRSTGIRPEVPNLSRRFDSLAWGSLVRALQRNSSGCVNSTATVQTQPFKLLSFETIKA
jgi:hypothetical protein